MFSLSFLAVVVVLAGAGIARPLAEHEPPSARRLPSRRWYHDEGHPALQLFRRDLLGSLPAVGTPGSSVFFSTTLPYLSRHVEWKARFPKPGQVPTQSPDAWLTALNASIAAGLIPTDVPLATGNGPYYPSGVNGYNKPICSASFGCNTEDDSA